MKIKKCGFLLSLVMLICFALPSFASAEYETESVLPKGTSSNFKFFDGNLSTYEVLRGQYAYPFSFKKKIINIESIDIKTVDEKELNSLTIKVGNAGSIQNSVNYKDLKRDINYLKKLLPFDYLQISNNGYDDVKIVKAEIIGSFEGAMNIADITSLDAVAGVNDVNFSWKNPNDPKFKGVQIYNGGRLLATVDKSNASYKVSDLEMNTNYKFRFVALYEGDKKSKGVEKDVKTLLDPNKIPPSNVSNLKAIDAKEESITISWKNPTELSFDGVKIYVNDKYVATVERDLDSYIFEGLKADSVYKIKVTSINKNGGETEGSKLEVSTSQPILDPPKNIVVTPQNGSLVIAWNHVESKFLKGYNIYVNGQKVNGETLLSNKLNVKNLQNGEKYKIEISSVNKNGVEGKKSEVISESPSENAITVDYDVKMPFSPLDLITSSFSLLALLGGFILLSIAIIWFKPLKELIVKAARKGKDKK